MKCFNSKQMRNEEKCGNGIFEKLFVIFEKVFEQSELFLIRQVFN